MTRVEQVAFVLVRTKAAGNIGAAARALKNMGFADLRLVAPLASEDRAATELAAHGKEIVRQAQTYPTLPAALHDRTLVLGTTCRPGSYRSTAQPLRAVTSELSAVISGHRAAFVFGPEDHGLSNDELKHCQRLITIPTTPEYTSINLAQSVMLVAYEMAMALWARDQPQSPDLPHRNQAVLEPAPMAELEAMLTRLEQALIAIGFLAADTPDRIMFALRGLLGRAVPNRREVEILNGMARQIGWFARGGRDVIAAKRELGKKGTVKIMARIINLGEVRRARHAQADWRERRNLEQAIDLIQFNLAQAAQKLSEAEQPAEREEWLSRTEKLAALLRYSLRLLDDQPRSKPAAS